jgi:hypothetical protein
MPPANAGLAIERQAIKLVDLPVQIYYFDLIGCARMCAASA